MPSEVLEVVGLPVIVAGAYFGGLRVGLLTALWLVLIATLSFFLLGKSAADDYIATVVGFIVVGAALGAGVEQLRHERLRLEEVVDVVERSERQLSASQRRYRLLFEVSNDAVYLHGLDADGEPTRFVAVNDAACLVFGYSREELLGLTPRAIDASPEPGQLRRIMQRLLVEERIVYESVRRGRDGGAVPVEISSSLSDVDGELLVLSISRDITGRKETERRLERLTLHDDLTGLLNRRGFYVMMPEHAKRAKRAGASVSLLYCDIDGFKYVNDSLGHRRGDEVLATVAGVLRDDLPRDGPPGQARRRRVLRRGVRRARSRSGRARAPSGRGHGGRGSAAGDRAEPQPRDGGHRLAGADGPRRGAHARRHAHVRGQAHAPAPGRGRAGSSGRVPRPRARGVGGRAG